MNAQSTGYTPRFGMPIIAPPPEGTAPTGHYEAIRLTMLGWSVVAGINAGIRIRFINPAYAGIYAMVGGTATFVPAGSPLPTAGAEMSPGAGSVVMRTWPADFPQLRQHLPANVPPPARIIYGNVNAASFRTAMTPLVAAMAEPALQDLWGLTNASTETDRAALEAFYLDEVMQGRAAVFVPGRQALGQAETDSPGVTGASTQLDLRFVDTGNTDLSPVLHLRSMPTWGGAQWTAHPLIEAVRDFPVPLNIYACFEVYNLTTDAFERLPAGVTVELRDSTSPDDSEAAVTTDAQGAVHFTFPDLADVEGSNLYFLVLTAGRSHAGHTLPGEWSTMGWAATDGNPGYFEDFSGSQLGDAISPLTYRVGLDFHGRLRYNDPAVPGIAGVHNAPPGIAFGLHNTPDALDNSTTALRRTSPTGEVHGVTFDFIGGENLYWGVNFEILDPSINLPRAIAMPVWLEISTAPTDFSSSFEGPYYKPYASNRQTSIGSRASPDEFPSFHSDTYDVALYCLKTLHELSAFLWHMTGGIWAGVSDLEFDLAALLNSWSWPVGEVNIHSDHHWDRGVLIHELSHQVMWRVSNFTTTSIAESALFGGLHLTHQVNLLANPVHALIEGWADYMECLFAEPSTYLVTTLEDGPDLFYVWNLGERVEGAFANALWELTRDLVMPAGAAPAEAGPMIPEAWDGDVAVSAPWILDPQAQIRFLTMIWAPLQDLATFSPKSTTTFINRLRSRNSFTWHRIARRLQKWNLAIAVPTVSSVTPNSGPVAGGQAVTITGTNFVEGMRVTIGGLMASDVNVTGSTSLEAITPSGPGPLDVDVRVKIDLVSFAGNNLTGVLPFGYSYQ